jgi:predicted GIY-YIG superfamily endonuclease
VTAQAEGCPGFTKRYDVDKLVWFESGNSIEKRYHREKQIKRWNREWKSTYSGRATRTGMISIHRSPD